MRTRSNERGQVAPLLAVLVVVAGAATLLLGRLGGLAVGRAQAEAAADAAALAGAAETAFGHAAGGRAAAAELAAANGGVLSGFEVDGADTQVSVTVGERLVAMARARRIETWSTGGRGTVEELAPAMRAAVARAEQLLGRPVPIVSGYRSPAQQAWLWANRRANPYPVARPGTSLHERGLAIDVPAAFVPTLRSVAERAGLCQPVRTDPIHFEVCRWNLMG